MVDTRIRKIRPLIPPAILLEELATPVHTQAHVIKARIDAHNIIQGIDDRLLVVIGPCSIHDPHAAIEYAKKLLPLAQKYKADLHVVRGQRAQRSEPIVCRGVVVCKECTLADCTVLTPPVP